MAHRAAPISVSIALGHTSTNAVRATAGGWSTGSSACLNGKRIRNGKLEGNHEEIIYVTFYYIIIKYFDYRIILYL